MKIFDFQSLHIAHCTLQTDCIFGEKLKDMEKLSNVPTKRAIEATHRAIQEMIHLTPVMTCEGIDKLAGCQLFFKCENFQKVGAFKMRGASSAAVWLTEAERQRGLATHSSGNHAQAIARAAKLLGVPAFIVMPENAPKIKQQATEGYGARIIFCESTIEAREATLKKVVRETGATFIHPYNDYNVIAGQATCAKELFEEVDELDSIIAPIGGGGLLSGTALSARYFAPNTKIYGAEPQEVDDAYRSFMAGELLTNDTINTIADGLRTNLGEKTFAIISTYVNDIFTVTEQSIIEAMRLIWERMKIIIEPSCAVPLAAILANKDAFKGQRVGVILTGGNVDLGKLPF